MTKDSTTIIDPTTIDPDATCFYCSSADCFCECTLLWEIHHKVGRGREGFDYTTTDDFARLVARGLVDDVRGTK